MKASHWLMAIRPRTLSAAVVPIVVGTSLAQAMQGKVRLDLMGLALGSSLLIQIGTNFINDAMDYKKGADTSERVGPKRVTQSGLISASRVWWAGILMFGLAAFLALPLVGEGGIPILIVGLLSLLAGYGYTGGPFPLAYVGLGDLFVLIFFGWVAICGTYYLNTHRVDFAAAVAGTQVGLLATVMIAINNFRDHLTDRKAKKMTPAARWGPDFSKRQIAFLCYVPFILSAYWLMNGFPWAALLPFGIYPLAHALVLKIQAKAAPQSFALYFAQGAALHLVFGLLLSLGLVIK